VDKVEDVVNRGDVVDVTVVEVDRARGRIGLRIVGTEGEGGDEGGSNGAASGDGDDQPRRRRRRLTAAE
jgi:polyribonucleotide nucleotidyltransferase